MLILYISLVTPTALVLKIFRKKLIRSSYSNDNSYWENRDNSFTNFKDQF